MDRMKLNYLVDAGAGISLLASMVTGIIKFPGFLQLLGLRYGSLPMDELSFIHDWGSLLFGAFIAVHLVLHWRWVTITTKSVFRRGT